MKVSIILPTYCERDNIGDLLAAITAAVAPEAWQTELLVVDDNSPDGTAQMVEAFRQTHPQSGAACLVRTSERGLASAILSGIHQTSGDVLVVMDTDFNHDPLMIPQMVKFLEFYDLVSGSRFVMGGGMEDRSRYYSSLFYNLFVRMLLQIQVQDNLSGFFAIRRRQLLELDLEQIFSGYGEYFIRLLYHAYQRKYRMLEVPVYYILRRHGQSKSRFLAMLRDYTQAVLVLRLQKGAR